MLQFDFNFNSFLNYKIGSLITKKSDYDYDECCCGGSCNCGCNHRVALGSKRPIYNDVPLAWGLYFQDGASPSFEGIVELHNRIMFYLIVILFGVSWIMSSIMIHFNKSKNKLVYKHLNHGTSVPIQKYSHFNNLIWPSPRAMHFPRPSGGENVSGPKGGENVSGTQLGMVWSPSYASPSFPNLRSPAPHSGSVGNGNNGKIKKRCLKKWKDI